MSSEHASSEDRRSPRRAAEAGSSRGPLPGEGSSAERPLVPLADPPPRGGDLDDAIACLRAARSSSPESDAARGRILTFADAHPDALHRSCLEGHLTASALVVDAQRERTLVMLHAKLGLWLQPGGHADGEGHLGTVALTEAHEETGIVGLTLLTPAVDCDVHTIPARGDEPEHLHLDLRFVAVAPPRPQVRGNHESRDLRWVTLDELAEIAGDESLVRLAKAGLGAASR